MPAAVSLFSARYPEVELAVLEAEPEESVPMLRAGELEVAIVGARNQPDGFGDLYQGLDLHHLLDEPRYALLAPDHRLARRKRLRLKDLADEVWIELARSPTREGRIYLESGGEPDPGEPRVAFRSDDFNVVQGLVAAGAGVAVVPELALTNLRGDISIHNLASSAPMRTIAAATLAGVHRSPATSPCSSSSPKSPKDISQPGNEQARPQARRRFTPPTTASPAPPALCVRRGLGLPHRQRSGSQPASG